MTDTDFEKTLLRDLEELTRAAEKQAANDAPLTGWICPKCGAGNAPWNAACGCTTVPWVPAVPAPYPLQPWYPSLPPSHTTPEPLWWETFRVTCSNELGADIVLRMIGANGSYADLHADGAVVSGKIDE